MKEIIKNYAIPFLLGVMLGIALILTVAFIGASCSGEPTEINAAKESIKASGFTYRKMDDDTIEECTADMKKVYASFDVKSAYWINTRSGERLGYMFEIDSARDASQLEDSLRDYLPTTNYLPYEVVGNIFFGCMSNRYDDFDRMIKDFWRIYE